MNLAEVQVEQFLKMLIAAQPGGGAMPILILSANPTTTPTSGLQSQFGVFAGGLYLHIAGTPTTPSTDTQWIFMSSLFALAGQVSPLMSLAAQATPLLTLASIETLLMRLAVTIDVPPGDFAVATIFSQPASFYANNDFLELADGGGGTVKYEFQIDGTFVPTPGAVTVDLQPILPAGNGDAVIAILNPLVAANTGLVIGLGGGGGQNYAWPQIGTVGNGQVIAVSGVGVSISAPFRNGFNEGFLSTPRVFYDNLFNIPVSGSIAVPNLRADRSYEILMGVGGGGGGGTVVTVLPDNSVLNTFQLQEIMDTTGAPPWTMKTVPVAAGGLMLLNSDASADVMARARIRRRTAPTSGVGAVGHGSHFEGSQVTAGAPTPTLTQFVRSTGFISADFTSLTFAVSAPLMGWLRITELSD